MNSSTTLVIASGNAGKLAEIARILDDMGITVVPQSEFGVSDADETGTTFVENALIKARHAARHTGLPALGDDSGLVLDALDGAPGIYSARYAGPGADDAANNRKLLQVLEDVPDARRTAHFYCAIAMVRHAADPAPLVAIGRWDGRILDAPTGGGGFGSDPLFHVAAHGCSSAELPAEVKNRISHRGRALRALVRQIEDAAGE